MWRPMEITRRTSSEPTSKDQLKDQDQAEAASYSNNELQGRIDNVYSLNCSLLLVNKDVAANSGKLLITC